MEEDINVDVLKKLLEGEILTRGVERGTTERTGGKGAKLFLAARSRTIVVTCYNSRIKHNSLPEQPIIDQSTKL